MVATACGAGEVSVEIVDQWEYEHGTSFRRCYQMDSRPHVELGWAMTIKTRKLKLGLKENLDG
jgi:hypothetical protein